MTSSIGCALVNAVDPDTNEVLHSRLEPTTNSVLAQTFVAERREKHDAEDAVVLIDGSHSPKDACRRYGLDYKYETYGNRNSVERIFREIKQRTTSL